MYKRVSNWDFIEEFKMAGRGEQFNYLALDRLFEYFEELEEELEEGKNVKFIS